MTPLQKAAQLLGRAKSERKTAAARANAKKPRPNARKSRHPSPKASAPSGRQGGGAK